MLDGQAVVEGCTFPRFASWVESSSLRLRDVTSRVTRRRLRWELRAAHPSPALPALPALRTQSRLPSRAPHGRVTAIGPPGSSELGRMLDRRASFRPRTSRSSTASRHESSTAKAASLSSQARLWLNPPRNRSQRNLLALHLSRNRLHALGREAPFVRNGRPQRYRPHSTQSPTHYRQMTSWWLERSSRTLRLRLSSCRTTTRRTAANYKGSLQPLR